MDNLSFQPFDCECTWWKLLQKHIVRTEVEQGTLSKRLSLYAIWLYILQIVLSTENQSFIRTWFMALIVQCFFSNIVLYRNWKVQGYRKNLKDSSWFLRHGCQETEFTRVHLHLDYIWCQEITRDNITLSKIFTFLSDYEHTENYFDF